MVSINPHIFREYDIRGVVDTDLSDEFARLLGRAYGKLARERKEDNIAIGFDCRHTSEGYAKSLAGGINDEGINATIIGMGPTPQAYWALYKKGFGGCIQVTGSHNPPDMNGFKMCLGQTTLTGDDIQDLKEKLLAIHESQESPVEKRGTTDEQIILEEYIADLVSLVKPHMGSRKLKIVVDAGNGVAGMVGPTVLRELGVDVIELYCEPDGNFPNHHPDPTVMENIKDLIAKVQETGADLGIGWDGDGDRIGAVDEQGNVIFGDMLLLLYARAVLKEEPGTTIIGDVKCSSRLFEDIEQAGGKPLMWKTGHSIIKNKLKEIGGALGGEMSGHIFFKHRFYGFDDAPYCAARLAELVSHHDGPISSLLADVPPMVATPEIRVDCPEEIKFKIPELAKTAFKDFDIIDIDGIRISFDEGWGLIRASNTQPVLVMRFEARSPEKLEEYQTMVTQKIEEIKATL